MLKSAQNDTVITERVRMTPDGRLTRADAARYLGVRAKTLAMWHMHAKGPASVLIGGRRFYYRTELDKFIKSGGA